MALVFEDPAVNASGAGLHAFIVGVSHYTHLPGGDGPQASDSFGMQQLTSTALSAYRLYEWLLQRKESLPRRLATVHMLLSPSAKELQVEPRMASVTDRALRATFAVEAKRWRQHAKTSNDGLAFFYFAGHGLEREKGDCVMLCDDFGDPDEGPLHNAVDIDDLFDGMAPPARLTETIARQQVYIVDACRARPQTFSLFERQNVPDLWPIELGGRDDRQAPVFFAAIPGSEALAFDGLPSLFNQALLACLNRDGIRALSELDSNGDPRYGVTVFTLDEALTTLLAELNARHQTQQRHGLTGRVSNFPLHYIEGRPEVDVVVEIDPVEAVPFVRFDVQDAEEKNVWAASPAEPHPYRTQLPAGFYRFRATVPDDQQPYRNFAAFDQVTPPRHPVKARVRR